jgi:hypothetical protein
MLCSLLCERNYNAHAVFCIECKFYLVYAVGEILAVTADCFLKEKSGHHILKVTNTNNHSLGV